ncbi:MAG: hypothetical protein AAGE80_04150 [Pseudomonadota bacterium]
MSESELLEDPRSNRLAEAELGMAALLSSALAGGADRTKAGVNPLLDPRDGKPADLFLDQPATRFRPKLD